MGSVQSKVEDSIGLDFQKQTNKQQHLSFEYGKFIL